MSDSAAAAHERLAELRASAKGWHGIQLAALGFIGLCGVINSGDSGNPQLLQVMSGILVLGAFALACAGIYLVGGAAWPLYRGDVQPAGGGEAAVAATSRRLTRGLLMTFLSIATLSLAAASSWWPQETGAGAADAFQVRLQTADGRGACGELRDSPQPGALRVIVDSHPIDVDFDSLARLSPGVEC